MASNDDATDANLFIVVIFVFVVISSFVGWCCLHRQSEVEVATIINSGYKCSEQQHLVTFIIAPCDGLADCDECNTVVVNESNDTD
jgi:hypothetical protein